MKTMNKLTALLLGAAMLGSAVPYPVPVMTAEAALAVTVRNCTLDTLMEFDEDQINRLPDLFTASSLSYAEDVKVTENFHAGELKLGKECFTVKLTTPQLIDQLYEDGGTALSVQAVSGMLDLPEACIEKAEAGDGKGYLNVTVDLFAYGRENACKAYIMTYAKLRVNDNVADVQGMSIGGGKLTQEGQTTALPQDAGTTSAVSELTTTTYTTAMHQDTRTAFFERIAGWEGAKLSDCIILEQKNQTVLLTPANVYTVRSYQYTPYSVYMKDCAVLDADMIRTKWKEMQIANGVSEQNGELVNIYCSVRKTDDCYLVSMPSDRTLPVSRLECLKAIPEIDRVEASYTYYTEESVSTQRSRFGFRFKVDGTDMPQPEDFPELTGVSIMGDVPLPQMQTESTWYLNLTSDRYEDYFAAAKYLQTLDFVHDLTFSYQTDGIINTSGDARLRCVVPTVLFDRSMDMNTRTAFFERIAGWQNAALSDCIVLGKNELLTPDKVYTVDWLRYTPYRFYMKDSAKPDADAILAKWKEILKAANYPEANLARMTCEITEADGGYEIQTLQDGYAGVSLLDCLKTFPEVQRIEAQLGYHTDSRPNSAGSYRFYFTVSGTEQPRPEDFPGLTGVQITGSEPLKTQTESTWTLRLAADSYADYFAAAKYLLTLDFVQDLCLGYGSTELGDGSDDAKILDPEPTVLFDRASEVKPLTEFTRDAFLKCILSREHVRDDDCIRLGDNELLTPKKPYTVQRCKCAPYCVYLREGGRLDADDVLAKWKEMLLAEGYPETALADIGCEITKYGDGYQIVTAQDSYKSLTLADCLKTFPDVQRIETQYGYRSDDFANDAGNFEFSFWKIYENQIQPGEFPELDIAELAYKTYNPEISNEKWYMTLNSDAYADYFAAVKYLLVQDDVNDLRLEYVTTQLAMEHEPRLTDSVPSVLFNRGDVNLDGSADVADAVLLARYLNEDAAARISMQGITNADADGNGLTESDDLTVILNRIAKKY